MFMFAYKNEWSHHYKKRTTLQIYNQNHLKLVLKDVQKKDPL